MISLTCTNCRATLSIDDAFAGGVCRCRHCGTIQTVPSRLKSAAAKESKPEAAGSRTLYRRGGSSDSGTGSGTGLDDLAEVVASSGLLGSGSGLTASRLRRSSSKSADEGAPSPRSLAPWLVAAGIVIVLLLLLVFWLGLRRSTPATAVVPNIIEQPRSVDAPTTSRANFCDIPIDGSVIVYVLDRGNGTRDMFDALKEATYKSIESLGSDRKFQVIFWSSGDAADAEFPPQPRYASKENLLACRRMLDEVSAFGQTDAQSALKQAFASHADVVIVATGKALELDQAFVDQVMSARKIGSAKIDTVALGDADSPILREIASRTGGTYQTISAAKLRAFGE